MSPAYTTVAAQSIGVGPSRRWAGGDMLEAIACFAPTQQNEAMSAFPPRLVPQPNGKQQNFAGPQLESFGVDSRFETAGSSLA
jgi:hypothetical protein